MDIEACVRNMSLDEKIGQMFMSRGLSDEIREMIRTGKAGNIQCRPDHIKKEDLTIAQEMAPIPLFVGADMENGLSCGTPTPSAMALGAIGCEKTAYKWAHITALEARDLGINFVFGPVVDIANVPENPLTNIRCLHSDVDEIIRLGSAIVRGYQENGLQVSVKHFPGTGLSKVDGHIEPIYVEYSREELSKKDLRIYRELYNSVGLGGVMSSHTAIPEIDGEKIATLSKPIISLLKETGFNGILITDSLSMKGVKSQLGIKDIIGQAMAAGHDIILIDYSVSPLEQFEYMKAAVKNGIVPEGQVDNSVRKILAAKKKITEVTPPKPDYDLHKSEAMDITRRSLTLLGDNTDFSKEEPELIIVTKRRDFGKRGMEIFGDNKEEESLLKNISEAYPGIPIIEVSETPDFLEMERVLDQAIMHKRILFFANAEILSYKGTGDLSKPLLALISGLRKRISAFVLFGNAYAARELPKLKAVILAYKSYFAPQAVLEALKGEFIPEGKCPLLKGSLPFWEKK